MGANLQKLKEKGVVDPDAADALDEAVIEKIEKLSEADLNTIINFKLDISGKTPWTPAKDGSIL